MAKIPINRWTEKENNKLSTQSEYFFDDIKSSFKSVMKNEVI